mgnify:CR=1 FL=1
MNNQSLEEINQSLKTIKDIIVEEYKRKKSIEMLKIAIALLIFAIIYIRYS